MVPHSITLVGVTRHAHTEITFPEKGIVLVTGVNGSGKSSIIEGIAVAGWGKTLRGTPAWYPDRAASVVLTTDQLEITRSRSAGGKNGLSWRHLLDDKAVKFESPTKAQEALAAAIGDFDMWVRTSVFSSADADTFTRAPDSERKRLLERILGLERFDPALERCRVKLRGDRIKGTRGVVDEIDAVQRLLAVLAIEEKGLQSRILDAEKVRADVPADVPLPDLPAAPSREFPPSPAPKKHPAKPPAGILPPKPTLTLFEKSAPAAPPAIRDYQPPVRPKTVQVTPLPALAAQHAEVVAARRTTEHAYEDAYVQKQQNVEAQATTRQKLLQLAEQARLLASGHCPTCAQPVQQACKNTLRDDTAAASATLGRLQQELQDIQTTVNELNEEANDLFERQKVIEQQQQAAHVTEQTTAIRVNWAEEDARGAADVAHRRAEANVAHERALNAFEAERLKVQNENENLLSGWRLDEKRVQSEHAAFMAEWEKACDAVNKENEMATIRWQNACNEQRSLISTYDRAKEVRDQIAGENRKKATQRADESQALVTLNETKGHISDRIKDQTKVLGDHERRKKVLEAAEIALGLKGIRGYVLGRALGAIETTCNAWLARIADPGFRTVLRPYGMKADGGVKDSISLEIQGAGGGYGFQGNSGGERRRVDIALMLGLAEVAAAAQGLQPGALFFDEVFDALDAEGIDAVVRAVSELSRNRLILIVTHSDELTARLRPTMHLRASEWDLLPKFTPVGAAELATA